MHFLKRPMNQTEQIHPHWKNDGKKVLLRVAQLMKLKAEDLRLQLSMQNLLVHGPMKVSKMVN